MGAAPGAGMHLLEAIVEHAEARRAAAVRAVPAARELHVLRRRRPLVQRRDRAVERREGVGALLGGGVDVGECERARVQRADERLLLRVILLALRRLRLVVGVERRAVCGRERGRVDQADHFGRETRERRERAHVRAVAQRVLVGEVRAHQRE
eukprot:2164641-Prymnesium_polylepis.1